MIPDIRNLIIVPALLATIFTSCLPAVADHHKGVAPDQPWSPPNRSSLWYDHPTAPTVADWLPIGDGRTCCYIAGGVALDDTAFESNYRPRGDMPIIYPAYLGERIETDAIHLTLPDQTNFSDYHRDLDLTQAVAHVSYTCHGIHYTRTCFWSEANRLIVIQMEADKKASYTGSITLTGPRSDSVAATEDTLFSSGSWAENEAYTTEVRVEHDGGQLTTNGHEIDFAHCNSLTILGANDDALGPPKSPTAADRISQASVKSENDLLNNHISAYKSLFGDVSFSLRGASPARLALPTDQRRLLSGDGSDPDLEGLFVQYLKYQRVESGVNSALMPTIPLDPGDALSTKLCSVISSQDTLPNLLANRQDVIALDVAINKAIGQSLLGYHNGEIDLLPNLPLGWTAGFASGLSAGSDFLVDVTWVNSSLATVTVHSLTGAPGVLRFGKLSAPIKIKAGKSVHLGSILEPEL